MKIRNLSGIYRDASKLLREHGWCQNCSKTEGRRCVTQALYDCRNSFRDIDNDGYEEAIEILVDMVRPTSAVGGSYGLITNECILTRWNDAPERTIEDVLDALKCAAHELDTR
jgi:hypothetical protein